MKPIPPTLETNRLFLRKLKLEDTDDLFEYASKPIVTQYIPWETHESILDSFVFLKDTIRDYDKGNYIWGIELKENNKMIGTIGLHNLYLDESRAEIGYTLSYLYWQKGLMTEALQSVCKYTFEQLGIKRLNANCNTENIASIKLLQKIGFQQRTDRVLNLPIKDKISSFYLFLLNSDDKGK